MPEPTSPQPAPASPPVGQDKVVERGKRQLLIAPRRGATMGGVFRPMSAGALRGMISGLSDLDVVRVLKPRKVIQAMSTSSDEATDVYVVRTTKDRAELLKQTAPPNMIIEEDHYLDYGGVVRPLSASGPQGGAIPGAEKQTIRFRVVGDNAKPVSGVKITLTGDAFPVEGESNDNGELALDLVVLPGGRPRSLYVVPGKGYWDRYVLNPDVSTTDVNVIKLLSLEASVTGFPAGYRFGWGQRLMGLDKLPEQLTGKGVKIGIIDSGADNTHPLLQHLAAGMDLTNNRDAASWAKDVVGHGSHCAGIIGARAADGTSLRGFAPDAEIHVFKIFPGGQFSSLLDAIDECMARDVDIINMSLGSGDVSQAVEQKITEAVLDGIACIVAAGNSGGPVQYPASSPNVLAVAAIGKLREFPSEAWDSQTVSPNQVSADGIFSPSFTCFGPQVAVCAPGVAIISTVPGGFQPESGTSMAAPHVTGLAALLLAHHPLFQTTLRTRGPQRVAALFNLIKAACTPAQLEPTRSGFGVPKLDSLMRAVTSGMSAEAANAAAAAAAAAIPAAVAAQPGTPQSAGNGQVAAQSVAGGQPATVAGHIDGAQFGQPGSRAELGQWTPSGQLGPGFLPFQAGPQLSPQGSIGGQLGSVLGSAAGSLFGQGGLGGQVGQMLGGLLPFQAAPSSLGMSPAVQQQAGWTPFAAAPQQWVYQWPVNYGMTPYPPGYYWPPR